MVLWKSACTLQPPNRGAREPRAISHRLEPDESQWYLIRSRIACIRRWEPPRTETFRQLLVPPCASDLPRVKDAASTSHVVSFPCSGVHVGERLVAARSGQRPRDVVVARHPRLVSSFVTDNGTNSELPNAKPPAPPRRGRTCGQCEASRKRRPRACSGRPSMIPLKK
jgi:hypothetical protein